jgi:hypothetical protein
MNAFFAGLIALFLTVPAAIAQSSTSPSMTLSIDQQNKLVLLLFIRGPRENPSMWG